MNIEGIRVIAPKFDSAEIWSEAEVLGAMIFLWSQQDYYRQGSVESALQNLLPIIRHKNFCLFIKDGSPIGYVNWAYFSEQEAEDYSNNKNNYQHYIESCSEKEEDKEMWLLTSFFPSGEVNHSRRILRNHIFKNQSVKFLHHKKTGIPSKKFFSGRNYQFSYQHQTTGAIQ